MAIAELGTIGVIGGTGKLGSALAQRWARAGHRVMIGSRTSVKAQASAGSLSEEKNVDIRGSDNVSVAREADVIILAIPFASQDTIVPEIAEAARNKIVVDTTVPLMPPKVMRVQLPSEGCAANRTQQLLGPDARVVAAFHNVAAHKLAEDSDMSWDVLVFSDDKAARLEVVKLANDAGMRGLQGGALGNAAAAEAMTSILIFINKHYKVDGAGIQITGELDLSGDDGE